MSTYKLKWNYGNKKALKELAVFFSKDQGLIGKIIGVVSNLTHAGVITEDHGEMFATEEGPTGLQENSLDGYTTSENRVVDLLYWNGWDNPENHETALKQLASIRRRKKENKYGWKTILCFLPGIGKKFKREKEANICSESVCELLDRYGFNSGWSNPDRPPSPDELHAIMTRRIGHDVVRLFGYYSMA